MGFKRSIQEHVYEKFYSLLSSKFFELYIKPKFTHPPKAGARSMWKIAVGKRSTEKYYIAADLFKTESHEFFYRKLLAARTNGYTEVEIDPLCRALKFIETIPIDPLLNVDNLSLQKREELLFNKFLSDYNLTNNNSLLEDNIENKIDILIDKFYQLLTYENTRIDAWYLLTENFQKRNWDSNFDKFDLGYKNFRGAKRLKVFNFDLSSVSEVECLVYYEDEIEAFTTIELSGLDALTIKEIDKLNLRIREMTIKAESLGINGFEHIEIYKLFDPVASEYIWFKCQFCTDDHYRFFSTKKSTIVKRLYQFSCKLTANNWRIEKIRKLPTFSSK